MILRLFRTFTSASASLSLSQVAVHRGFKHWSCNSSNSCCSSSSCVRGRQSSRVLQSKLYPPLSQVHSISINTRLFASSNFERMPEPPYQYLSADAPVLDLSDLSAKLQASDEQRQEAFDRSRKFQKALVEAQIDLDQDKGTTAEWIQTLQSSLEEAIEHSHPEEGDTTTTDRLPRIANLNQRVEDLCRLAAFHHFLRTGTMLPPSECHFSATLKATDEEYLAGACMGVAQDLSRYAMGRATARDFASVQQARDLVQTILEYLLQFDFRNGFLRRKYDGTKYALKVRNTNIHESTNDSPIHFSMN